MKPIIFLLLLVSLAFAQKAPPPKNRTLLVDFRQDDAKNPGKIPAATQRNVLSKVFRKYLTDANKCNSGFALNETDYLASARKAGQIVPSIMDSTTGSFTAAGQTQTLYVISVSECNASHADNFGTKRVAIFNGTQLVADVDSDFMGSIVKKIDLNMDGIDELLMISGDMAQGTLTEMATLVNFQNGRRHVVQDFGTVVEDSCASGMSGSQSKASVLYVGNVAPGMMPKLAQENYVSSCRNVKRWRFLSSGKPIE